jgi:hypothetical protein
MILMSPLLKEAATGFDAFGSGSGRRSLAIGYGPGRSSKKTTQRKPSKDYKPWLLEEAAPAGGMEALKKRKGRTAFPGWTHTLPKKHKAVQVSNWPPSEDEHMAALNYLERQINAGAAMGHSPENSPRMAKMVKMQDALYKDIPYSLSKWANNPTLLQELILHAVRTFRS